MFNENIDDIKTIVPSLNIIKLSQILHDIYKHGKIQYQLTPIDMMKIFISLGDKYKTIDKVILLMFGVKSIKSFKVEEEKIPIERINPNSLTEDEKEAINNEDETKRIKELSAPVSILDTNIGIVVIGYDYAYVAKETFTPNIEISEEDKKIIEDENIKFNINYPYIKIDYENDTLLTYPIYTYDIIRDNKQKYSIDYFFINIDKSIFKHIYNKEPIKMDENSMSKTTEEILGNKKLPHVDGYNFVKCFYKNIVNMKLVLEYKNNEDDKIFQFINYNDYSVSTVSFDYNNNEYIREKNYFINYGKEQQETQTEQQKE